MWPVAFCPGLSWCILNDLCFRNIVEGIIYGHEVTDDFDEVNDFNLYVLEEIISVTSTNDHDYLWV